MKPRGASGSGASYPLQGREATDGYVKLADCVVLIVGVDRADEVSMRRLADSMMLPGVRFATVDNWAQGAGHRRIDAIFLMSAGGPPIVDVQRQYPGTPIVRMQGTD